MNGVEILPHESLYQTQSKWSKGSDESTSENLENLENLKKRNPLLDVFAVTSHVIILKSTVSLFRSNEVIGQTTYFKFKVLKIYSKNYYS